MPFFMMLQFVTYAIQGRALNVYRAYKLFPFMFFFFMNTFHFEIKLCQAAIAHALSLQRDDI